MKTKFLLSVLLFMSSFAISQNVFENADTVNFPYDKWTAEEIQIATTTMDAAYLDDTERAVVILANLTRTNPKLFSKTFLLQYVTDNDLLTNSNVKSLQKTLRRLNPLHAFIPDKKIYELAKSHAIYSGKKGRVGHQNFSKRSRSSGYGYFAENCQYGYDEAMDIFMELLIDDGVPSLGHRLNFISPDTRYIGVSLQPHKRYEYNCVIDFGGN
jgi:uncharacterized protein YkwD